MNRGSHYVNEGELDAMISHTGWRRIKISYLINRLLKSLNREEGKGKQGTKSSLSHLGYVHIHNYLTITFHPRPHMHQYVRLESHITLRHDLDLSIHTYLHLGFVLNQYRPTTTYHCVFHIGHISHNVRLHIHLQSPITLIQHLDLIPSICLPLFNKIIPQHLIEPTWHKCL